jgi:hypothetical protein
MIFRMITLLTVLTVLVIGAGCSQDPQLTSPTGDSGSGTKNGTEVLGPPSIAIASGSGLAEGGVGMVGVNSAQLTVDVPADAQVVQALLYWAGGATTGSGDSEISLDGNLVQGELIGGPVLFFGSYEFFAYRADITGLGLVAAGMNTFTVADFDFTGTTVDENNGASILVIYDNGDEASIILRDGLDMAYFGFEPTLDATVPQVFSVDPESVDRVAELTIVAASVGENRPSVIKVTTNAGDQLFEDGLGSVDGLTWDSLTLAVDVPAGADEVSVQIISTPSTDPLGASLGWVAAGLALQPVEVETFAVTGVVFEDASVDATFDGIEWGIGEVVVELVDGDGGLSIARTDFNGQYRIDAPAGVYTVRINLVDYPDDINADLAVSFDATTVLSLPVTIGPDSPGHNFGFTPRAEQLAAELENGDLLSNGQTLKYWTTVIHRGLIEEQSERMATGHDGDTSSGDGWGHDEEYFTVEDLLGFIDTIEGMYLFQPYQFTDGMELEEVYDILKIRPKTDEERLYRELLVTELNFVAGLGIVGQADVLGVLISWGESLLADGNKSMDKGRAGDIVFAYNLFEAINTGGGGGVDE